MNKAIKNLETKLTGLSKKYSNLKKATTDVSVYTALNYQKNKNPSAMGPNMTAYMNDALTRILGAVMKMKTVKKLSAGQLLGSPSAEIQNSDSVQQNGLWITVTEPYKYTPQSALSALISVDRAISTLPIEGGPTAYQVDVVQLKNIVNQTRIDCESSSEAIVNRLNHVYMEERREPSQDSSFLYKR